MKYTTEQLQSMREKAAAANDRNAVAAFDIELQKRSQPSEEEVRAMLARAQSVGDEPAVEAIRGKLREIELESNPRGFMPFASESLSKALGGMVGAPFDLTNAVLRKARIPIPEGSVSQRATGGLQRGMEAVGIPVAQDDPNSTSEYIGQVAGEMGAMAMPMGAGVRALGQTKPIMDAGRGVTRRMAEAMNREMVNHPMRSAAAEAGGMAGAGFGRELGEMNDMGPLGSVNAEIVGGVLGGVAPLAALHGPTAKGVRLGKRVAGWATAPWVADGPLNRASQRMQELVGNPEDAVRKLFEFNQPGRPKMRPATATEDPGLMALDKVILDNPAMVQKRGEVAQRTSETVDELIGLIRRSGDPQDSRSWVALRKERLQKSVDARVETAAEEARSKLAQLDPNAPPEEFSLVVRESIETALADARVQEAALWGAVPQDTIVPTNATAQKFRNFLDSVPSAQRDDIPAEARRFFGETEEFTTLNEMDGLYKKLGEVARDARANNRGNQSRIAEELRDAIIQDMGNAPGSEEVRASLREARQFSRYLNEKFRKGPVGKILQHDSKGGPALPDSLTLEATAGRTGERGKLGTQAILSATGEDIHALEGVQSYFKARFMEEAVVDGVVVPAQAQRFLQHHRNNLDLFPTLRAQLQSAKSAEDVSRRVTKKADAFRSKIERPAVSHTAAFLGTKPGDEMAAVMNAKDPEKAVSALLRTMRKDSSGQAAEGMKAAMSEWLVRRAMTNQLDETGKSIVNGVKMSIDVRDPKVRAVMAKIYTPDEFRKVQDSIEQLKRVTRWQIANAGKLEVLDDGPSRIMDLISRYAGARAGAHSARGVPGASIQLSKEGAERTRNMLRRFYNDKATQILVDAMEDPELMKALLLRGKTATKPELAKRENVLRTWLASRGSRFLDDEEE